MSDGRGKSKAQENGTEKTVIRTLTLAGLLGGGCPSAVDVKDGRIVRIRPLHYDWKYDKKNAKLLVE